MIYFGLDNSISLKYISIQPPAYFYEPGNEQLDQHNVYCIEPNRNDKADLINKTIVKTEKAMGNGFFFGLYEGDIVYYSDYLKDLISIEKAQ